MHVCANLNPGRVMRLFIGRKTICLGQFHPKFLKFPTFQILISHQTLIKSFSSYSVLTKPTTFTHFSHTYSTITDYFPSFLGEDPTVKGHFDTEKIDYIAHG